MHEHASCSNYVSDSYSGFMYHDVGKNEILYSNENKYHCIIFILEGDIELEIDNEKYNLKTDSSIFIPSSSGLHIKAIIKSSFILNYFDTPIDLCEKLALEELILTDKNSFSCPLLNLKYPLKAFLISLKFYLEEGISCKHFHAIKEKEMFFIFRFFYTKKEVSHFFKPLLSKNISFKNIVLKNYRNTRSVKELAQKCNYSLSSFNHCFKANFDDSPYSWLQKQKLKHIKTKLKNKDIPLSHIVDEFSFSSPSHLTSFCKKYLEISPSEYRKLNS